MSSSDGKPMTGAGSLFDFLFDAETRARADEKYRRAVEATLAEDQERQAKEKFGPKETKEDEPKCWVN